MKGRHSTVVGPRRGTAARQAALAVAPVAAIAIAVGTGAAGLLTDRSATAAAGAAAGAGAVVLELAAGRTRRRRSRAERSRLRGEIRDLTATVVALQRQLAAQPAVLPGTRPPLRLADLRVTAEVAPLPVVDAFDLAGSPPTPRSLPILTPNRRGLQSCTPGTGEPLLEVPVEVGAVDLPGRLPAQRPPATPITGYPVPPDSVATLPALPPGPAVPLSTAGAPPIDTGGLPLLEPGPSMPALVGVGPAEVVDLRARPARDPLAHLLSAAELDDLVFAVIAARPDGLLDADGVAAPGDPARQISLFRPLPRVLENQEVLRRTRSEAIGRAVGRRVQPGWQVAAAPLFVPGAVLAEETACSA